MMRIINHISFVPVQSDCFTPIFQLNVIFVLVHKELLSEYQAGIHSHLSQI